MNYSRGEREDIIVIDGETGEMRRQGDDFLLISLLTLSRATSIPVSAALRSFSATVLPLLLLLLAPAAACCASID